MSILCPFLGPHHASHTKRLDRLLSPVNMKSFSRLPFKRKPMSHALLPIGISCGPLQNLTSGVRDDYLTRKLRQFGSPRSPRAEPQPPRAPQVLPAPRARL